MTKYKKIKIIIDLYATLIIAEDTQEYDEKKHKNK